MRRHDLFVPAIVPDRNSAVPLSAQIYKEIAQAIRSGAAPHHHRLPSTRILSSLLQVSRNTVLAAYDELVADGLIEGQRGACMRINATGSTPGVTLFGLHGVIRDAHYPARVLSVTDPDGNPLYIRF